MPNRSGTLERTHPALRPLGRGKPYLIVLCLGRGRSPHPNVLKGLQEVSCAPLTPLFKEGPAAYGFRSTLSIGEISQTLESTKSLLAGDSFILVELGSDYLVLRADSAKTWLRKNMD